MNLYTVENITETKTVLVGTKNVPNLKLAEFFGDMLYYNGKAFECNRCSADNHTFGDVIAMDNVMINALEHYVNHHKGVVDEATA